jgi:hypothetical protein
MSGSKQGRGCPRQEALAKAISKLDDMLGPYPVESAEEPH